MVQPEDENEPQGPSPAPRRPERPATGAQGVAQIDSAALFGAARELLIAHEGECYRLRRTSKGKLILTK